ncbi:putative RMD1-protein required for meiotic division [Serendipita vermifera]|nr:putative RMD1-protein required for meiotic division [Serendipita vermifera]
MTSTSPTIYRVRYASTSTNSEKPSAKGEHLNSQLSLPSKSKSNTSLRKAASASLPIREKTTPTRGAIRPVFTMSTAERYQLRPLFKAFKSSNATMFAEALWMPEVRVVKSSKQRVVEEDDDQNRIGEAFIFENGCAVVWGIEEEDARRFLEYNFRKYGVEVGKYAEKETEEVEFVTDPSERTRLQGDLIILGETPQLSSPEEILPMNLPTPTLPVDSLAARYAFSEALARSTALSALENGVEDFLSSASRLPDSLASTGKPGLKRTEIIKKMGLLLKFRQRIFLNPQNFTDMPEVYWSEPTLEKYFQEMSDALDIKSRTQLVNAKITYAVELQSVMRELLTEASGHRMELIIIALIAFEATLAFIREGPEIWRMISNSGSQAEEENPRSKHHA